MSLDADLNPRIRDANDVVTFVGRVLRRGLIAFEEPRQVLKVPCEACLISTRYDDNIRAHYHRYPGMMHLAFYLGRCTWFAAWRVRELRRTVVAYPSLFGLDGRNLLIGTESRLPQGYHLHWYEWKPDRRDS